MPEKDEPRFDALRELGTIGSGHAATALATLVRAQIVIDVPCASLVRLADLSADIGFAADDQIVVVSFNVMGDLTGKALMVMDSDSARRHRGRLGAEARSSESSLSETGSIAMTAYLNALSELLGAMLIISAPRYNAGASLDTINAAALEYRDPDPVLVAVTVQYHFEEDSHTSGHFVFLPDPPALRSILAALQLD
ncbi:MAG: chemotaxis protein CheC [Gemmatimonadales bacterium]